MATSSDRRDGNSFMDFSLEVSDRQRRTGPARVSRQRAYQVRVSSPAGTADGTMRFPFTAPELENRLIRIENALLSAAQSRRVLPSERQREVEEFGQALFDAVLSGEGRGLYYQSRSDAERQGKGLRVKLRVDPPELATLPWEFLFDSRQSTFVGLSTTTPIVRDLGLVQPEEPITVEPPLRILGMIASPRGLEALDHDHERQRVEDALADLQAAGAVELRWLEGQTWRDLHRAVRRGSVNVFHFVGHGGFSEARDEGLIALADEDGDPHLLPASDLSLLLADEAALRLVVLNSCDGARGGDRDVFSSTASILVRNGGVPAVLAMQYEITDEAAIHFSREFYEAIADGMPIDAAVGSGRKAVRLALPGTLEWATPVLYQRAPDGVLFHIRRSADSPRPVPSTPDRPAWQTPAPGWKLPHTGSIPESIKGLFASATDRGETGASAPERDPRAAPGQRASNERARPREGGKPAPPAPADSPPRPTSGGAAAMPSDMVSSLEVTLPAGATSLGALLNVRPAHEAVSPAKRGVILLLNVLNWIVIAIMAAYGLYILFGSPTQGDLVASAVLLGIFAFVLLGIRKTAQAIQ